MAWERSKQALLETCQETLGFIQHKRKTWISDDTWNKIEERRIIKEKVLASKTRQQTKEAQDRYNDKDKEENKGCKGDKKKYVEQLAEEAERACNKGDIKSLYNITRQLSGGTSNTNTLVRDKNGKALTKPEEQLTRWQEHFQEVLNRPPPTNPPSIESWQVLKITTRPITKTEVTTAIKHLKNGKAGGIDNIPPEAIKALYNISIKNFHNLLNIIWE